MLPQIATGDLDITVVGQLPTPNLPFGDQFEPRPVEVLRFEAALRRRSLWKQDLENASGHAHHTLIFADAYTELDDGSLGVPVSIGWKAKEHGFPGENVPRMFYRICRGKVVVSTRLFSETAAQCHGATTERCFSDMRVKRLCRSARRQPRRSAKLVLVEAGGE